MLNKTKLLFNYNEFIHWIEEMLEDNTKNCYPENKNKFTDLNFKRMQRLNKNLVLNEDLVHVINKLPFQQTWYVITEPWCGDSAQILPVIAKIADASAGKIILRILLRDQNPELIQHYHTEGSHSIPKIFAYFQDEIELFVWGPRPREAQELFKSWKNNPKGRTWNEFEVQLHTWYAIDKTQSTQNEFYELLSKIIAKPDPDTDVNFLFN